MPSPPSPPNQSQPTVAVTFFRWLMISAVFPLLPIALVWLVLRLNNQNVDWTKSTDLLFLTVMLTLSAASDIANTVKTLQTDLLWTVMYYGMMLGFLLSMFLYGILLYNLNSPNASAATAVTFRQNLQPITFCMGLVFIAASIACRYMVAKVESRT